MRRWVILMLALSVLACSGERGAPLSVADIRITRPLPGTSMSAGYFLLQNDSSGDIVVTAVDSPQFARVDMHETVIDDDVSRMRRIDQLHVDAGERVRFEPGGKHLMLIEPQDSLQAVTLNFYSGGTLLLSVNTTPTDP